MHESTGGAAAVGGVPLVTEVGQAGAPGITCAVAWRKEEQEGQQRGEREREGSEEDGRWDNAESPESVTSVVSH